jgi:transcription antitermination factor NusG
MMGGMTSFQPGDRVRVKAGTFAGDEGDVLSPREDAALSANGGEPRPLKRDPGWVRVALSIFGRRVPVTFTADQLEKP